MDTLGGFVAALLAHWWALMSCAIFTLLGFWEAVLKKSRRWHTRATFYAAVFCLFLASFFAWNDEHNKVNSDASTIRNLKRQLNPSLTGRIGSFGCGPTKPGLDYGVVMLMAEIMNPNGPPTIATTPDLQVWLNDGVSLPGEIVYPDSEFIQYGTNSQREPLVLHRDKNLIYSATQSPIPAGGEVAGWIMFRVHAPRRSLEEKGTKFKLSFEDIQDHSHSFEYVVQGMNNPLITTKEAYRNNN